MLYNTNAEGRQDTWSYSLFKCYIRCVWKLETGKKILYSRKWLVLFYQWPTVILKECQWPAQRNPVIQLRSYQVFLVTGWEWLSTPEDPQPVTSQHLANWLKEILIFLCHNLISVLVFTMQRVQLILLCLALQPKLN